VPDRPTKIGTLFGYPVTITLHSCGEDVDISDALRIDNTAVVSLDTDLIAARLDPTRLGHG
jgi:hypothetical protein